MTHLGTWRSSRNTNDLFQLGSMMGIAYHRPGHKDKADEKNSADQVTDPVTVVRVVFC